MERWSFRGIGHGNNKMERRSFRGIKQWRRGASGALNSGGKELQGNKTVEERSFRGIKQWREGASGK